MFLTNFLPKIVNRKWITVHYTMCFQAKSPDATDPWILLLTFPRVPRTCTLYPSPTKTAALRTVMQCTAVRSTGPRLVRPVLDMTQWYSGRLGDFVSIMSGMHCNPQLWKISYSYVLYCARNERKILDMGITYHFAKHIFSLVI